MTFSIVARCVETNQFGIAISSSSPAVAARCAFAKAGVGVVASQNITDPRLGPKTLLALTEGYSAPEAIAKVIKATEHADFRQLLAVDISGTAAIHSGSKSLGVHAKFKSLDVAAAGNLLANSNIPMEMVTAFNESTGHLGDRLINAMRAALTYGGETGPLHSAGLLLVDKQDWPMADLRCDWTESCPIEAVAAAWHIYKPQMDDYVTRALDPTLAPSYGVPGDD
ncbi:MAG: DUF1028 domain-containing protein [Candidatus Puniceispirillaceae bacterium]